MSNKKSKIKIGDEVRVRGGLPKECPMVGLSKDKIYIIVDMEPNYNEQEFAPFDEESVDCELCDDFLSCKKALRTDPIDLRLVSLATMKGPKVAGKYDILWFERYNPNA